MFNKRHLSTTKTIVIALVTISLLLSSVVKPIVAQTDQKEWKGQFKAINIHGWHQLPAYQSVEKWEYSSEFSFHILAAIVLEGTGKVNFHFTLDKAEEEIDGKIHYCHGEATGSYNVSVHGMVLPTENKATITGWGLAITDPESKNVAYTAKCTTDGSSTKTYEDEGYTSLPIGSTGIGLPDIELRDGAMSEDGFSSKDPSSGEEVEYHFVLTIDGSEETIEVSVDPAELSPLDTKAKSKVTITVEPKEEGKEVEVEIQVCTKVGSGGHLHDNKQRADDCKKGSRPTAQLDGKNIDPEKPIVKQTDREGKIVLEYTSPRSGKYIIAGEDRIIAKLKKDPSVKDEKSITTKLPYELKPMPGAENCVGGESYFFESQSNHACLFYGTEQTNNALLRIADAFVQKQKDCKNGCEIKDDKGNLRRVTISGEPLKMKITAMSLPLGGLHDINGKWKTPHKTHDNGKVADIGFGNFQGQTKDRPLCDNYPEKATKKLGKKGKEYAIRDTCKKYDIDRILLLRDIITQDSNPASLVSFEGGDLQKTFMEKSPHFHINFGK